MKKRTTPPTGRRHSGFTLIEMLIVVAIIAILIAVSIPVVSSALENARVATDEANERSAKAAALLVYLSHDPAATTGEDPEYDALIDAGAAYNAMTGKLEEDATNITPYGKCVQETHKSIVDGETCVAHSVSGQDIIYVKITPTGTTAGEVFGGWGSSFAQGHYLTVPTT